MKKGENADVNLVEGAQQNADKTKRKKKRMFGTECNANIDLTQTNTTKLTDEQVKYDLIVKSDGNCGSLFRHRNRKWTSCLKL